MFCHGDVYESWSLDLESLKSKLVPTFWLLDDNDDDDDDDDDDDPFWFSCHS